MEPSFSFTIDMDISYIIRNVVVQSLISTIFKCISYKCDFSTHAFEILN